MQKRTLFIIINAVAFLSIIIVGIAFSERLKYQVVYNFISEEQDHEMTIAENISNTLQSEMENIITIFAQIAELPEIQESDAEACNKKLDSLFLKYGRKLANIKRMNAQGIFDCSHNRAVIGINGPERAPHLKAIIEDPEHRPVLGRIITQAAGAEKITPTTSFHVPIFDRSGQFFGTLGGEINFGDLKEKYLKDVSILQQGYIVIQDDNNDILYHPRAEFMGENVWSEKMQNATNRNEDINELYVSVAAGKKGVSRYVFEGVEKIAAYAPATVFPGRTWSVIVTVPIKDLQKVVLDETIGMSFSWLYGVMIGAMILFFGIMQFFEARWMFSPLKTMNAALKKITQGDLTAADFPLGGGKDEFSQLAENLKLALSSLRKKNKQLDTTISEKTRALQQKVEQLEKANKAMAGRELKMMELKKEIEELKKK